MLCCMFASAEASGANQLDIDILEQRDRFFPTTNRQCASERATGSVFIIRRVMKTPVFQEVLYSFCSKIKMSVTDFQPFRKDPATGECLVCL